MVDSTSMSVLDYGDILNMCASLKCFHLLGTVYYET